MARRVLDVFLSSTAMDLAEHRKAVFEEIVSTGRFFCVRQEDFGAQNASAVEFCRSSVERSDLFVGLIGIRRGWEPEGDGEHRSITEMEHDWAREAGRPRYIWVSPENFPETKELLESDEQRARQMQFRKRMMHGGERIISQQGFGGPELLAGKVVKQLLLADVAEELLDNFPAQSVPTLSREEQAPAVAAAVERLVENRDVDLLALVNDPRGINIADLEAKLVKRAEEEAKRGAKGSAEYWRHIGALSFLHDAPKALAAYSKAVDLDPDNPEGWRYLGELHHYVGDLDAAHKSFDRLREVGETNDDKGFQSLAHVRLSWIQRRQGDLTSAQRSAEKALELAMQASWLGVAARAYGNLGLIFETRGDLKNAEKMHLHMFEIEEQLGHKEGMAAVCVDLGSIYHLKGNYERAEEMELKAVKLCEAIECDQGLADAYFKLGSIYLSQGFLEKAEKMLSRSLDLNGDLESITVEAKTESKAVQENRTRRKPELSLPSPKEGTANALNGLGQIYLARGELKRAEDAQLKALRLNEELGRKEGLAVTHHNLGLICKAQYDNIKLCEHLCKERDLWSDLGLMDKVTEVEIRLKRWNCNKQESKSTNPIKRIFKWIRRF